MDNYKYVQKSNVITVALILKEDGLHIAYTNERFCKLLKITYPYQKNELILNYIGEEYYHQLLHVCQKLHVDYDSYESNLNYNFNDIILPMKLIIVPIDYFDTTLYVITAIDIAEDNTNKNLITTSDYANIIVNSAVDCIFTLQITPENQIILDDYNKFFLAYFGYTNDQLPTNLLQELFPPYIVTFLQTNCELCLTKNTSLRRLLNYCCTSCDLEYLLKPQNNNFHIHANFIPYSHLENRKVICCFHDLTGEMLSESEAKNLLEEYNAFFNTSVNATAIFVFIDSKHSKLERINIKMLELLMKVSLLQTPYFCESRLFKKLLCTKSTIEKSITIRQNNSILYYKITLIPVIHNNEVIKAIVTIVDTTKQVNMNQKEPNRLTPRENEIIEHVLAGEKNSYIAQKLNVSIGTVKRTLFNVYGKLNISSRVDLINYYHSIDNENK